MIAALRSMRVLPYAANLEQLAVPQVADIVAAAREVAYR